MLWGFSSTFPPRFGEGGHVATPYNAFNVLVARRTVGHVITLNVSKNEKAQLGTIFFMFFFCCRGLKDCFGILLNFTAIFPNLSRYCSILLRSFLFVQFFISRMLKK